MRYITNQEDSHRSIRGKIVYPVRKASGADHEAAIETLITDKLRVNDMDNGFDETFHVRFDDERCFEVYYETWPEHEPEWQVRERMEIKEIPLSECAIKEAPGEYVVAKIKVSGDGVPPSLETDDKVIGVFLSTPPRRRHENAPLISNASGSMPVIITEDGRVEVRTHVSIVSETLNIPAEVFVKNGWSVVLEVKRRNEQEVSTSLDM